MCARTSRWCMNTLLKKGQEVRYHFFFMEIDDVEYDEVVKLFYVNLEVPKGTDPFLSSQFSEIPSSSLSLPSGRFWTFPKKVTILISLPMTSCLPLAKPILMSFLSSRLIVGRPPLPPTLVRFLRHFLVVYWKCYPSRSSPRLSPYRQSLFMYAFITNWKISVGYIIFQSMRATHTSITDSNP